LCEAELADGGSSKSGGVTDERRPPTASLRLTQSASVGQPGKPGLTFPGSRRYKAAVACIGT